MPLKLTTTDMADAGGGDATVFARIPEPLPESARKAKYDLPLGQKLAELGIEHAVRGFSLPVTLSHPASVGVEVRVANVREWGHVALCLSALGAPRQTSIECEIGDSIIQASLGDLLGR